MTTLILATIITGMLYMIRSRSHLLLSVWREASWWEKTILCLAVLPIPGPIDELAGVIVVRRIVARRSTQRSAR